MAAENEIVRLALGGISLLASIIDQYEVPEGLQRVVRFTMSSFAELEESKVLNKKLNPRPSMSKDVMAKQIMTAVWHVLSIGRLYNGLYLKGKKPRDFIRESISYDKELRKENADDNQEGTQERVS